MTAEEKNYRTARLNSALAGRGSGWVYHFDAVRMPAADYPDAAASHFPDFVSRLIDNERRELFLREGAHFETEHALLVMYTPPLSRQSSVTDWFKMTMGLRRPHRPAIAISALSSTSSPRSKT